MPSKYLVKILAIKQETPDVKTFVLEKPQNFSFLPGQFALLSIPGTTDARSFSFRSSPLDFHLMFTIKLHTKVTKALFSLKPGDEITVTGSLNSALNANHFANKQCVFLAGGTGIVPFLSIISYVVATKTNKQIFLFNSNKTLEDIISRDELETLQNIQHIHIINTLTRAVPLQVHQGTYEQGHISQAMIEKYLKHPEQYVWGICGSPAFAEAMQAMLNEMHIPKDALHVTRW